MYAELERKICSKCMKNKPLTDYYKTAGGVYYRARCKSCSNSYHKEYRKTPNGADATKKARDTYHASPDNVTKDKQNKSEWARFKKYGLVKSDFDRMLQEQNHTCAICPNHHSMGRGLVVDHCHDTSKVRALLCDGCNRGLGFFDENAKTLQLAAEYVMKFKK